MRYVSARLSVLLVLFLCMGLCRAGYACTTFIIEERDGHLLGRNYDFMFGDGQVVVNKRGVSKTAFQSRMTGENGQPAAWTSRFGSVTFNQFGREFPQGGMNEAGLALETMALSKCVFPKPDERPYIPNALLWRQYILDTCSSVKEAIDSDSSVRISYDASKGIGVHFLMLDAKGDAAVVEFLDGKTVIHWGESLPVKALTNSTYQESLSYWRSGTDAFFDNSINRFVIAAKMAPRYDPATHGAGFSYAFDILKAAARGDTRWSIVYDNRLMKVRFRTDGNSRMRTISLKEFDFSCQTPVKTFNVNGNAEGDVTPLFEDYSPEFNLQLTRTSFGKLESRVPVPDSVVEFFGKYPEQCKCDR